MTGYSVKIMNASKELSARDRVAVKDTTNAIALDDATRDSPLVIAFDYYVELAVHNEKSEDKDYKKYVVVDKSGNKFVTGSESFFTAMIEIMDEMSDSGEDFEIQVSRMPSSA